ncbi:hypothetical protein PAXRUDRAFT_152663, partial [Paxillus rubicundulus Ve08.2h10]
LPLGGSGDYEDNLKKIVTVHNQTHWDKTKTETGLTKPPLILGLHPKHCLSVPLCITTDIMHLAGNISNLLITLWCGTMDCGVNDNTDSWDWTVLKDPDVWIEHGKDVSEAGYHLPRSYDHKPYNIAKNINSQYKMWEFQLYTFGIVPGLLHGILPQPYWRISASLSVGFKSCANIISCKLNSRTPIVIYRVLTNQLHSSRAYSRLTPSLSPY